MEDLLGALMQGAQQEPEEEDSGAEGDPLGQLLQGLLGGQGLQEPAAQEEPPAVPEGMDFGNVLQDLLGGEGQAPAGYEAQPEAGIGQGGLDLGGLLQGVLGGGGGLAGGLGQAPSSGGGDLGGLLGALMGGGSPTMGSSSFLAPIVSGLADKLGLPPEIAQVVVTFVLSKLMGQRLQPGMDMGLAPSPGATRSQSEVLEDALQRMNSGERVTKTSIRGAGLVEELSAQTGLDRETAEASIQEVLNSLGAQLGPGE